MPPGAVGLDAGGAADRQRGLRHIACQAISRINPSFANRCESELEITDETHVLGRASLYA